MVPLKLKVSLLEPGKYVLSKGVMTGRVVLGVATVKIDDHDVNGVSLTVQAPHLLKGMIRMDSTEEALPAGLSLWLDASDELAAGT